MNEQVDAETYRLQLIRYQKFSYAVRQGFADASIEEYVALKKWLRDNFRSEFVEIF